MSHEVIPSPSAPNQPLITTEKHTFYRTEFHYKGKLFLLGILSKNLSI
jgi:hypothetical protein